MSPSSFSAVLMFALLASAVCISGVSSESVHAGILNRLGGGKTLSIHCQSGDNDLGPQTVADGSQYGWDFSVNVSGTTLFFCDVSWAGVSEFHFNAYEFGRDSSRCSSNCSWIMAEEGVYGLNDGTGFWEFMFSWTS